MGCRHDLAAALKGGGQVFFDMSRQGDFDGIIGMGADRMNRMVRMKYGLPSPIRAGPSRSSQVKVGQAIQARGRCPGGGSRGAMLRAPFAVVARLDKAAAILSADRKGAWQ